MLICLKLSNQPRLELVKGWRVLSKTCFVPHNSVQEGCRIGEKGLLDLRKKEQVVEMIKVN